MALARIIAASADDARVVSDYLSRLGYSIETVAPGAIPDTPADLEVRVEHCFRSDALREARAASAAGYNIYVVPGVVQRTTAAVAQETPTVMHPVLVETQPIARPEVVGIEAPSELQEASHSRVFGSVGREASGMVVEVARVIRAELAHFSTRTQLWLWHRRNRLVMTRASLDARTAEMKLTGMRFRSGDSRWIGTALAGGVLASVLVGLVAAHQARRPASPLPEESTGRYQNVVEQSPFGPAAAMGAPVASPAARVTRTATRTPSPVVNASARNPKASPVVSNKNSRHHKRARRSSSNGDEERIADDVTIRYFGKHSSQRPSTTVAQEPRIKHFSDSN